MQWHRLLQNAHSFLLSSLDTVFILSLLFFSAKYVNILYLLHPQLSSCTPIQLDHLTTLPHAWASCVAVAVLTVFTLTQVLWNVNTVFGLCWQRIFLFLWSLKTALRSPRIANLTKSQHIHCTHFAEEILSYTPRIIALTMEFVGIWIG